MHVLYGYLIDENDRHSGSAIIAASNDWQKLANKAVELMLSHNPKATEVMDRDIGSICFYVPDLEEDMVLVIQEEVDVL